MAVFGKAFTTAWLYRIMLIRFIQERLAEFGMGRFVSHYGRTRSIDDALDIFLHMAINSHIRLISVPALLSTHGDEIKNTPWLDEYFNQWKSYRAWKGEREKVGVERKPPENMGKFVCDLCLKYDKPELCMPFIYGDITLSEVMLLLTEAIFAQTEEMEEDPAEIVEWINQNVLTEEFDPAWGNFPKHLWYTLHPTLDIDWTVIKSYILLRGAYRAISQEDEETGFVPPYFVRQQVKTLIDEELYEKAPMDREGLLTLTLPSEALQGKEKIVLDTYGLKLEIPMLSASIQTKLWVESSLWGRLYASDGEHCKIEGLDPDTFRVRFEQEPKAGALWDDPALKLTFDRHRGVCTILLLGWCCGASHNECIVYWGSEKIFNVVLPPNRPYEPEEGYPEYEYEFEY